MGGVFKKSDIAILVATMNRDSPDFLKSMFPGQNIAEIAIIVVNQTMPGRVIAPPSNPSVQIINSFEKGLSASRNLALLNTDRKLCLLADDDIVYQADFIDTVLAAFNQNPDAALITFRTLDEKGALFKKYPATRKSKLSAVDRLSIMSVEMALNNAMLKEAGLKFDNRFGLGTNFPLGEEAVLANQLHSKGMKMVMEPQAINSHPAQSSSETLSNTEKYFTLGAVYTAIFGSGYILWTLLKLFFDAKQQMVKPHEIGQLFKKAITGHKKYKAADEKNDDR